MEEGKLTDSGIELSTAGVRDIGWAVRKLKAGRFVARQGWNGKGMYLWLLPATVVPPEWCKEPHLKELAEQGKDAHGGMRCLGSVRMRTADGSVLTGWLASQTDLLAEDWTEVWIQTEADKVTPVHVTSNA